MIKGISTDQARTYRTLALLGVGGVVAYEVIHKFFPPPPTPGGTVVVNPGNPAQQSVITQAQANVIADGIEVALYGSGWIESPTEDEATVIQLMEIATNDADVNLIMNTYGERGSFLSKITLAAAIRDYLSTSDIAAINSNYASKGIQTRF